jgi:hypothetical protein
MATVNPTWQKQYGATPTTQAAGYKDPVAQQVAQQFYGGMPGSAYNPGSSQYDKYMQEAQQMSGGQYGGYLSPLDPMYWQSMGGSANQRMIDEYNRLGGQAFATTTPAPATPTPLTPTSRLQARGVPMTMDLRQRLSEMWKPKPAPTLTPVGMPGTTRLGT